MPVKRIVSEYDPHHCKCFYIDPSLTDKFRKIPEEERFQDTNFQFQQGQIYGLVKNIDNDKQTHVRVMPDGELEAEIESCPEYPFAHLNQKHSYSAHPELEELLKRKMYNKYHQKKLPPLTCIKRIIV